MDEQNEAPETPSVTIVYTLMDNSCRVLVIDLKEGEKFNFRSWFNTYMTKCDGWFPLSETSLVSHKNLLMIQQV